MSASRVLLLLLLLAVAPVPGISGYAGAQNPPAVSIAPSDSTDRDAVAGHAVTASFLAINHSAAPVAGAISATVPKGWRMLSRHGDVTVASRGREVVLVSAAIPRAAAPGVYVVAVSFTDRVGKTAEARVRIRIRARREVAVELLEQPGFIPAGERYTATYNVSNRGNAPLRVRLRASTATGFRATLEPQELDLAPGESRPVRVVVNTPASLPSVLAHTVTLTVEAADGLALDSTAARSASSLVEVIPTAAERETGGHALPIAVTVKDVRAVGGGIAAANRRSERSVEVIGSGPLREGGRTRFDFRVNTRKSASFLAGDREEYRFALNGRNFDVWLGDQVYSLTPLLEPGRYAFGGGGRATFGRMTLGGFTHRNRYVPGSTAEHAGYAALRLWGRSDVSVAHMVGSGRDYGADPHLSRISSARTRLFLPFHTSLELEYASGDRARTPGHAWTGQLLGALGWSSFELRRTVTDSTFPGAVGAGLDESYARLALTPWRRLWVRASYYDRISIDPRQSVDPFLVQDRRRYSLQATGAGYGIFGVEHERTTSEPGSPVTDERSQELTRLRVGKRLGRLYLAGAAETGSSRLFPTEDPEPFQKVSASTSISLGRSSLSMSAERVVGRTIYAGPVRERIQGGIHATLRLGAATEVRLAANGYRFIAADTQSFGLLDATLTQRLFFNHSLIVRSRRMSQGTLSPARNLLEMAYRIPFGIRVPGSRKTGTVRTHVYDGATRQPVAGALVRLGGRVVVTDARGSAVFSSVQPGVSNTIQLDRRGASGGMIPAAGHELRAQVAAGRSITVEIPLVTGGHVAGRVRRFDIAEFGPLEVGNAPRLTESDSIPPLVITLSNGEHVRRRAIDQHGGFAFADVSPGVWTVRVSGNGSLEQHALADSVLRVTVAGADTARVELRLLPRTRRVRVVSSGTVGGTTGRATTPVRAPFPPVLAPAAVEQAPAPRSVTQPALPRSRPAAQHWYRVSSSDRSVQDAAFAVYRDASLWPKIWVANRAIVPDPDRLGAVQWLLIPDAAPLTSEEVRALNAYRNARRSR